MNRPKRPSAREVKKNLADVLEVIERATPAGLRLSVARKFKEGAMRRLRDIADEEGLLIVPIERAESIVAVQVQRFTAKNPRLCLDVTPGLVTHLSELLSSGLYGRTIEECAERLLCRAVVEVKA